MVAFGSEVADVGEIACAVVEFVVVVVVDGVNKEQEGVTVVELIVVVIELNVVV